jgi:hypothetical protein
VCEREREREREREIEREREREKEREHKHREWACCPPACLSFPDNKRKVFFLMAATLTHPAGQKQVCL